MNHWVSRHDILWDHSQPFPSPFPFWSGYEVMQVFLNFLSVQVWVPTHQYYSHRLVQNNEIPILQITSQVPIEI